ncbi:hypothetical protein INS49_012494 [Diaporthe citri]|uniref:uncharacterized protein n=1 Tax=Diaporthe citri TaxID=83186 RepID=UPI001C8227DE|nr:uncharacterized protein INS49_012494 [Diaporthe citri]KAG6358974.1 hypothetical protein INS49_012494 [Diaporthe citri]
MSLTTVDHAAHAFRRRVNVAALKPAVIKSLGARLPSHVDYLIQTLQRGTAPSPDGKIQGWSSGKNMTDFLSYCIMDIMSDLTFTQTLNVQREAKNRHFVSSIPKGVGGMHLVGHMQCMLLFNMHKVLFRELTVGVKQFMDLSRSFADERFRQYHEDGIKGNDIWEKLLVSEDPATGRTFTREELASEASLMITGGTDGMITTLTSTLFYLLHNPQTLSRLTTELRARFPVPSDGARTCPISFGCPGLQNFTYLLACLDESMRLSSPVPSILPRRVGPGGIAVDGQYFAAGTCLGIPHYCLHRNEEVFPEPFSYKPERWMAAELGEKTDSGHGPLKAGVGQSFSFTPFGAGRSSCVGKPLAYQEMSYILARLLWELDLRLDPDDTLGEGTGLSAEGRGMKDEFQTYCCFVSWQDGPVVQFRLREDLVPEADRQSQDLAS